MIKDGMRAKKLKDSDFFPEIPLAFLSICSKKLGKDNNRYLCQMMINTKSLKDF